MFRFAISFLLAMLASPAFANTVSELTTLESMVRYNSPTPTVLAKIASIRRNLRKEPIASPAAENPSQPVPESKIKRVVGAHLLDESTCEAASIPQVEPGMLVEVLQQHVSSKSYQEGTRVRVTSTLDGAGDLAPIGCEGTAITPFLAD